MAIITSVCQKAMNQPPVAAPRCRVLLWCAADTAIDSHTMRFQCQGVHLPQLSALMAAWLPSSLLPSHCLHPPLPPPFPFSLQVSHLHFRLGVGAMQAAFPADDSHLGRSRRAGMSSSHTQRYVLAALWVLSISSWPHPKNREGRVAPCSESWG